MTEELIGLTAIVLIGISAQWLAWRLKIPSILILLIFGLAAGPFTGYIDPDRLLGGILFPVVSLSVALILFEGGLSLKLSEIWGAGSVVQRLISTGAFVTWILGALLARFFLGIETPLAFLLGAILVVTGPTVIIPLLASVRPARRVSSVLRWEGILIDPIGAVLAVLVYEAVLAGEFHAVFSLALAGIVKTLLIGGFIGAAAAFFMVLFLKYYLIPDYLENPISLMTVIAAFTASNFFQPESGLLAVTVMGAYLANQKTVSVRHIIEFKETLTVLLISGLFIILAARIRLEDLERLGVGSMVFLIALIVIVRPVSVFLSTVWSDLKYRERAFIALVAPRGIVAAAVSSVFAFRLVEAGVEGASEILPVTFLVIIGSVIFYGLGATYFARLLGLAQERPSGFFILGAHPWATKIAQTLKEAGLKVVLADTNPDNVFAARLSGIPAYYGSGLSEQALIDIEMEGIGRLLALTSNDGVNSLAVLRFNEVFERSELYQLVPRKLEAEKKWVPKHLQGRYLFGKGVTYEHLARKFEEGAVIKKTKLTEEFDMKAFKAYWGEKAIPLFIITATGEVSVFTAEKALEPKPGDTVVTVVEAGAKSPQ